MSIFTYGFKVNKILKNENAKAHFSPAEIIWSIVNLLDARRNLSSMEYYFVSRIVENYRRKKEKNLLSRREFLDLTAEMTAHLDLVAPYYRFCGNSKMKILELEEDVKYEYRQRAKKLLYDQALFGEEWMRLHKEFSDIFWSGIQKF